MDHQYEDCGKLIRLNGCIHDGQMIVTMWPLRSVNARASCYFCSNMDSPMMWYVIFKAIFQCDSAGDGGQFVGMRNNSTLSIQAALDVNQLTGCKVRAE